MISDGKTELGSPEESLFIDRLVSSQFRNFKIVYRRYAGLYFCICVDVNDNNLAYLEAIHNFVEVLNEYFHNVCELDLVFNFYKVGAETSTIDPMRTS